MGDGAPVPVARIWEVTGADLADPAVVELVSTELMPRMEALAGFAGGYLLLDRDRPALLAITFWRDEAARDRSLPAGRNVVDALVAMASAESVRLLSCEVLASRPPAYPSADPDTPRQE